MKVAPASLLLVLYSVVSMASPSHAEADDFSLRGGGGVVHEDGTNNAADTTPDRRLNIYIDKRWKDRLGDVVQVPYKIDSVFSSSERQMIEQSIQDLADRSKVVKFVPRTNQAAYINVVDKTGGCSSRVGKSSSGKEQDLNLSRSGCMSVGAIQREFLHALGFTHEQNRPDRDSYVEINWNNIIPKNRHNFVKAPASKLRTLTLGKSYEYSSVLHYGSKAFAINRNVDTIIVKTKDSSARASLGQRRGATSGDILDVRLLYQCHSGPRSLASYQSNPCTSDCKCWSGQTGCNDNDDACQGTLTCSNNQCVSGGSDGGSGSGGECTDFAYWVDDAGDGCDWYAEHDPAGDRCEIYGEHHCNVATGKNANEACCVCGGGSRGGCTDMHYWVDVAGDGCDWYAEHDPAGDRCEIYGGCSNNGNVVTGKTANEACCVCGGGSLAGVTFLEFRNAESPSKCLDVQFASRRITLNDCNDTPAQKWWVDSNFYIRSALDTNKCIVGSRGDTDKGTNLFLFDCYANDDRFIFKYKTDDSFRPKNDNGLCVCPSRCKEVAPGWPAVHLWDCNDGDHQKWQPYEARHRNLGQGTKKGDRDLQMSPMCRDVPLGWYDAYGDNCEWYSIGTRCDDYGSSNMNFGKTANQACCSCQGGSLIAADRASSPQEDSAPTSAGCWDSPIDWTDSVGDSCMWYAQGDNCHYYGSQFAKDGVNAHQACCVCGGGSSNPPPVNDFFELPGCSDSPSQWMDAEGDDCSFYAQDDNCALYGEDYVGELNKTANEACCACGGGYNPNLWTAAGGEASVGEPADVGDGVAGATAPVESMNVDLRVMPQADPICGDSPAGWMDVDGNDCSFYAEGNNCELYGADHFGEDGKTANEVCCVCEGGTVNGKERTIEALPKMTRETWSSDRVVVQRGERVEEEAWNSDRVVVQRGELQEEEEESWSSERVHLMRDGGETP